MIRPESPGDRDAVREVHAQAFAGHDVVPDLVDVLRAGRARAAARLIGVHCGRQGRRAPDAQRLPAGRPAPPRLVDVYSLSPLGVLPEFRRRGIGTALVVRVLAEADGRGVPLVFLEGSPRYYGTRGFQDATRRPSSPRF